MSGLGAVLFAQTAVGRKIESAAVAAHREMSSAFGASGTHAHTHAHSNTRAKYFLFLFNLVSAELVACIRYRTISNDLFHSFMKSDRRGQTGALNILTPPLRAALGVSGRGGG